MLSGGSAVVTLFLGACDNDWEGEGACCNLSIQRGRRHRSMHADSITFFGLVSSCPPLPSIPSRVCRFQLVSFPLCIVFSRLSKRYRYRARKSWSWVVGGAFARGPGLKASNRLTRCFPKGFGHGLLLLLLRWSDK